MRLLILLIGILFIRCKSDTKPNSTSSIIHSELQQELEMIVVDFFKSNQSSFPEISILITENYVYLYLIEQIPGCADFPGFYHFYEKFNQHDIQIAIQGESYGTDRFFNLKELELNKKIPSTFQLCHPDGWSYRYKISDQQRLILENEIIEGSSSEDILMEEDEKYRTELIEEMNYDKEALLVEPDL